MSYAVAGLVRDYQPAGWPSNQAMVPHGISVIVNAPAVFRFTGPACPDRHLMAAQAMGADVSGATEDQAGDILADRVVHLMKATGIPNGLRGVGRSEEHTSELQSLMRISYAVFCLKKKKHKKTTTLMTQE